MLRAPSRLGCAVLSLFALSTADAQKGKPVQEFTRQGLLITNFAVGPGSNLKQGRRAADALRSRMDKEVDKRTTDVIDGTRIRERMTRIGFDPDTTYSIDQVYTIGLALRADEYVEATISNEGGQVRITSELVLMRDWKMRQPLPPATGATLDDAADLLVKHLTAARAQLVHLRRCENAVREGSGAQSLASSRAAIAAYPGATLGRICLAWSLQVSRAPQTEILAVANQVLAIDSNSFHAIESAAVALDSLRQRQRAADMWLRLADRDPSDINLAQQVIMALVAGGNAARAEPFVIRWSDAYPDYLPLTQRKWQVTYETKNWRRALEAGEKLVEQDSVARSDPIFWLRMATAYRADSKPFRAIEILARGVTAFPNEPRLYSLYTQYIRSEADTVIPRGLALFPRSADLLALNAKELRARGKLAESLEASKLAMTMDSTMAQGELVVAQLEIELGRPDSALSALRRALARGEDTALVARFALAKGNALYKAANGTKTSGDFGLALRFLRFSDTLSSAVQSRFLIGATAFGLAQAAFTEASKLTDRIESCRLNRLGADMIPIARAGLLAGQEAYGDAAKQSLEYLVQLDPYAVQQLATTCKT